MIDNGKISTIIISLIGALLAYILANPTVLEQLMGNTYLQYGAFVIVLISIVYNALYPRNPTQEIEE